MSLEREMETFDRQKAELEKYYTGKFVVIKDDQVVGAYDTFESAAMVAVQMFGRGPYLIRQIGAPVVNLPASVLYRPFAPVAA
jgi:hypothetical protein